MSELCWLSAADGPEALPDPSSALLEPNGLLAAGGSLRPEWLLSSYARGIFPWYQEGQPILWWSPDPRMVLIPDRLKISRSLRKTLRRTTLLVTADRAFSEVVRSCAAPRIYTDETWITADMLRAYTRLHALGHAHSFEAWNEEELVGGLYGVAIGRVFFGESMFARARDASKVALVHAAGFLIDQGFELIDCQMPTAHLRRLGASEMPRDQFLRVLRTLCASSAACEQWSESFSMLPENRRIP